MKKFILLSLILLSTLCSAQMTRTNYTGAPFKYVTWTSKCNDLWVVIQPGNGASGYTIDQLAMVGYGRAASTQDLEFNVLIVQAKPGYKGIDDYVDIKNAWPKTFAKLNIKKAVCTGYSLGGKETVRQIWLDSTGVFVGFVVFCGDFPYGPEKELLSPVKTKAPVRCLAGDADKQVSYWYTNTVNTMINSAHPGQSQIKVIPGADHGAVWSNGYSLDPKNQYGSWIRGFINEFN